jgi:hypothetical protein
VKPLLFNVEMSGVALDDAQCAKWRDGQADRALRPGCARG